MVWVLCHLLVLEVVDLLCFTKSKDITAVHQETSEDFMFQSTGKFHGYTIFLLQQDLTPVLKKSVKTTSWTCQLTILLLCLIDYLHGGAVVSALLGLIAQADRIFLGGVSMFSPCLCGFSPGTPVIRFLQFKQMHRCWLIADSKLDIGINVSKLDSGVLSPRVSPMTDWWPVLINGWPFNSPKLLSRRGAIKATLGYNSTSAIQQFDCIHLGIDYISEVGQFWLV